MSSKRRKKSSAKVPSYCLHKASGKAVVRINGKDHYLGEYGSSESHEKYEQMVAKWRASNEKNEQATFELSSLYDPEITIAELLLKYREFAESYYVRHGKPSTELDEMRQSLRPLRQLFGSDVARDFGPRKLKLVRQHMIDVQDLSRGVINKRINRIKRFFRWAVAEELVLFFKKKTG